MNMNEFQAAIFLPSKILFRRRSSGFEFHSYSRARHPIGSQPLASYANSNFKIKLRPSSSNGSLGMKGDKSPYGKEGDLLHDL